MSDRDPGPWTRFWRVARWFVVLLAFAAGAFTIILLRRDETQSRWIQERQGILDVFIEKSAAPGRIASFRAELSGVLSRVKAAGLDLDFTGDEELLVFAVDGSFASITMDDPLLSRELADKSGGEKRLIAMLARRFGLGEIVAPVFTPEEGELLLLDLGWESEAGLVHGLSHLLARRSAPEAVRRLFVPSLAFDERAAGAFFLMDECAALFAENLVAAGGSGQAAAYEALLARRFAPEGVFMRGERLSTFFSADPHPPAYYREAARLADRLIASRGLEGMAAWTGSFLRGEYAGLEELAAALGYSYADIADLAAAAGG
jgi:hypothetical protein